jgi:hypothetical protein
VMASDLRAHRIHGVDGKLTAPDLRGEVDGSLKWSSVISRVRWPWEAESISVPVTGLSLGSAP